MDDVEVALGEMCNVVKDTYGGDKGGFVAGQVFALLGLRLGRRLARGNARHRRSHRDRHLLALVRRARALARRCGIQGEVRRAGGNVHGDEGAGVRHALAGRAGGRRSARPRRNRHAERHEGVESRDVRVVARSGPARDERDSGEDQHHADASAPPRCSRRALGPSPARSRSSTRRWPSETRSTTAGAPTISSHSANETR